MPAPSQLRQTHTYVEMDVSASTYDEIRARLVEAGYTHCLHIDHDGREILILPQIGLSKNEEKVTDTPS